MEKPLPFIIENQGELKINEEVIKIIEKSFNPRLLLFYGTTRQGKSTTLNQIIRGNIETWKYINKSPFLSRTSQTSLTEGCDIYGPIKISEILRRHKKKKNLNEDFDIFFCDTEGLFSLNGQSKFLIPGILTLLQICTFSVIMINTVPDTNTVNQIASEIQFTKILQQINKELKSPMVSIYISGYQIDILEKDDFDACRSAYEEEREVTSDLILKTINEKFPQLNITKKEYKVIPGGPYKHNYSEEPDHDDLEAKLYWQSIHDIVLAFFIHTKDEKGMDGKKLISLMKVVFDIFKEFKELPKDPDLANVLLKFLTDNFNKYSLKQFEKINEEIKKDLKNNYDEYYKILNDDNSARIKLNSCIEENMLEIYKSLIPDKMKNFFENGILKLRNSIEIKFEKEFEIKCKEILSNNYINNYLTEIKNEINKAKFKEDINMNIIDTYKNIWNIVENKYEKLFIYFKTKKPKNIDILKNNFNNLVEKIVKELISKKKEWKIFFEEIKGKIQKEINIQYFEIFRTVKYQEDFKILIKTNEKLSKELIETYNKKYFNNLPNNKKTEAINWIKKICEIEYNKLKEDNKIKPIWENISKNIKIRIVEIIKNYINDIFNGKNFRNEIDPNLGRNDIILSKIPNELIKNPEISEQKQKELMNYLNIEVNNGVILFNKKREELPLLENALSNVENLCNKIADKKINELISQFYYAEDKISFNVDNFFSLFKKDENIILKTSSKNKEFNNIINKVSQKKAYEYNNILVQQKPSWNKIKENIRNEVKNECIKFYRKVMENKTYKEDIKYNINELDNSINSLNIYKGIMQNKHNEIKYLIEEEKEKVINRIKNESNNLKSWSEQKEKLVQEGNLIMLNKSNANLETKDLKQITNILLNEVLNTPGFLDSCKNDSQKLEIKNKLMEKAEITGKNYLCKIENDEKKFKKLIDKNQQDINNKNNKINNLEGEIKNLKNIIDQINNKNKGNIHQTNYFPATPYRGNSIVDGLVAIGAPHQYGYRAKIAQINNISNYRGTPDQNLYMLKLLIEGRLIRP